MTAGRLPRMTRVDLDRVEPRQIVMPFLCGRGPGRRGSAWGDAAGQDWEKEPAEGNQGWQHATDTRLSNRKAKDNKAREDSNAGRTLGEGGAE